ncbi:hypothetical protein B0H17DRAFT_1137818 [Mycena rosella]|uniref:Uncharacterized protein n=1 Tax=Mycena rosella TaxID=1033263 RepID=A0AAD7D7L2_MYCRO|nr:hypothetical protein B0H17DRAFT_1137818 [Mycena rosella]
MSKAVWRVPDQDIPLFGWGGTVAAGLMRMTLMIIWGAASRRSDGRTRGGCQKRTGRVRIMSDGGAKQPRIMSDGRARQPRIMSDGRARQPRITSDGGPKQPRIMYDGGPGMQSHHTHHNFLFGMVHLPPSGGTRWVII